MKGEKLNSSQKNKGALSMGTRKRKEIFWVGSLRPGPEKKELFNEGTERAVASNKGRILGVHKRWEEHPPLKVLE